MNRPAPYTEIRGLREFGAVSLLLLLIFLFDSMTLRQGHSWGDDFALYIHHGENIALDRPYAATGYIYNQREAWYGPRTYPPVFPVLLAPVIKIYGLDFTAMKMEQVVAFTASLLLIYLLFRDELTLPYSLALLVLIGFNPTLWEMKDNVTSDYPFWFFFLLSVLLIGKAPRDGSSAGVWRGWTSRVLIWGVCTGAVIYLSYGTRSIGLMILPGFAIYEAFKYRKATVFAIAAFSTALVLMLGQRILLGGSESSYADQFHPSLHSLLENVHDYTSSIASFWPWSAGRITAYLLFAVVTVLAAIGCYRSLRRRGLRPLEPILVCYGALILIWPGNQGLRFLLPIIPVYLAFSLIGLSSLTNRSTALVRWGALSFLLVWAVGLYAADYRTRDFARIPETSGRPSFVALCHFIRQRTKPDDVIVFYRARALSLFTDRPASVYFLDGTPALYGAQWRYFRQIGTDYIVYSRLFEPDRDFLKPVLDRHANAIHPVYRNPDFTVYQMAAGD